VRRTRKRQVAQAQVHTTMAQALAGASERVDVVDGHDHRTGTAQNRAVDPRRMEHVGVSWAARLDDLDALAGDLAQRGEQAARIATDAAHLDAGPAVEGDPQHVRRCGRRTRTARRLHV
jgi:hypothetical protein